MCSATTVVRYFMLVNLLQHTRQVISTPIAILRMCFAQFFHALHMIFFSSNAMLEKVSTSVAI